LVRTNLLDLGRRTQPLLSLSSVLWFVVVVADLDEVVSLDVVADLDAVGDVKLSMTCARSTGGKRGRRIM
jgi:hypothetical protein